MAKTHQITLRIPEAWRHRFERLQASAVREFPSLFTDRPSVSAVMRKALYFGMVALESGELPTDTYEPREEDRASEHSPVDEARRPIDALPARERQLAEQLLRLVIRARAVLDANPDRDLGPLATLSRQAEKLVAEAGAAGQMNRDLAEEHRALLDARLMPFDDTGRIMRSAGSAGQRRLALIEELRGLSAAARVVLEAHGGRPESLAVLVERAESLIRSEGALHEMSTCRAMLQGELAPYDRDGQRNPTRHM